MPVSFISRTRLLPYHGTVKVQEGDWVTADAVVAELDYVPGFLAKQSVARQLGIPAERLSEHMLHNIGDQVEQGELLASSLIFGDTKESRANVNGYLSLVSNSQGAVYLRQPIPIGDGQPVVIDLAKAANLSLLALAAAVRIAPGRIVAPGQILVVNNDVQPRSVTSPIYGRVESYRDGVVTIVPLRVRPTLQAYLSGRVQQVIPQQGIEVRAFAHVITGAYGVGGEGGGKLLVAATAAAELTPAAVTPAWKDRVVVAGCTASLELLQAAAAVGCAGLVVARLDYGVLKTYVGSQGRPGITGEDELLMPLVMTERLGYTSMLQDTWQELAALEGRYASISGKTQIRAGLVRPEVVVCLDDWPVEAAVTACSTSGAVQVGDRVRILRSPHQDRVGQVVGLPADRQTIVTGASLRVAEVEAGSQRFLVPLANLLKLPSPTSGRSGTD